MVVRKIIKPLYHRTRRLLAKRYLKFMPARQIALTGSQGKTNTTYALSKILTSLGKVQKTDTNLDTIYNVPMTALKIRPWHKFVLFELGVDHVGEMSMHLDIVKPQVSVITGISPVHTDEEHFGSLEKLIEEKRKLIQVLPHSGYAVLNYDDINVRKMAKHTKAHILWYGTDPEHCDVWADNVEVSINGLKATFHDGEKLMKIETCLIGKHQIYTLMASYLVGKIFDLPQNKFLKKIKELKPLKGRMSIESGPNGTILLNDSLRSNPSSMAFGLSTFSDIAIKKGKKIAILADMGELEDPVDEHKKIGKLLATLKIDQVICIGPFEKFVHEEAIKNGMSEKNIHWAPNVFEAAPMMKDYLKKENFIYIKGSKYKRVDRIFGILKGIKPKCNVKGCEYYNPSFICTPLKCGIPNHIHHDDTHH